MKKLLIALAAVVMTVASYGQGSVVFGNIGGGVNAPVFLQGTQQGPGPEWNAQLYLVSGGSATALTPATTFRAPTPGAGAIADRYWNTQTITVPGVAANAQGTFVVRAWHNSHASYDAAVAADNGFGQSAEFTVTLGGGINPPANLTTLQSFEVVPIPEPSVIALGILGAAALALRRRK